MANAAGESTSSNKAPGRLPPTIAVKIDRPLVAKARLVAADRDLDTAAYLSGLIRRAVGRDFERLVRSVGTTTPE
jgi:hypothetical protein